MLDMRGWVRNSGSFSRRRLRERKTTKTFGNLGERMLLMCSWSSSPLHQGSYPGEIIFMRLTGLHSNKVIKQMIFGHAFPRGGSVHL